MAKIAASRAEDQSITHAQRLGDAIIGNGLLDYEGGPGSISELYADLSAGNRESNGRTVGIALAQRGENVIAIVYIRAVDDDGVILVLGQKTKSIGRLGGNSQSDAGGVKDAAKHAGDTFVPA